MKGKALHISQIVIRVPSEIEARLKTLAEKTGRTRSYYVREAILEHLGDLEDIYLAEKELENIRAGHGRTTSHQALGRELGLDD